MSFCRVCVLVCNAPVEACYFGLAQLLLLWQPNGEQRR